MYRKNLAIMFVLLLTMSTAGCGSNTHEETMETQVVETISATVKETIPGVEAYMPEAGSDGVTLDGNADKTNRAEADDATENTVGANTDSEETTATEPTESENTASATLTEYEVYLNMSGDEQLEFINSFESTEAFFNWLNAAKAEYEALNPPIEIGDGTIDMSDIVESD